MPPLLCALCQYYKMPSLNFVLPHWLYWSGLLFFPLIAAFLARKQDERKQSVVGTSLPIAYMLWITGGFVGLHRFYLRKVWIALVYLPLFVMILVSNHSSKEIRVEVSDTKNNQLTAKFDIEEAEKALANKVEGAQEKLDQARASLERFIAQTADATERFDRWELASSVFGVLILLLLIVDAFLLPRMHRSCIAWEKETGFKIKVVENPRVDVIEDPTHDLHSRYTDWIDTISDFAGQFVCYWSLLAVFVYYYEVIARYVFNSPTNWAHEGMFLMFGMQYLISGAYALREDSHVRVDVVYLYFSDRMKAWVDVITSVFFFIFSITLMLTGIVFAIDSVSVLEVSFTEWAIQYWPVKLTIGIGGLLLTLQGGAKAFKDILILKNLKEA